MPIDEQSFDDYSFAQQCSKKRLSDDQKFQMIKLIRENEFLWNAQHLSYRDVRRKRKTFEEIREKLGLSQDIDVISEFAILRGAFNRETRRLNQKRLNGEDPVATGNVWRFYDCLSFLDNHKGTRSNVVGVQKRTESETSEEPESGNTLYTMMLDPPDNRESNAADVVSTNSDSVQQNHASSSNIPIAINETAFWSGLETQKKFPTAEDIMQQASLLLKSSQNFTTQQHDEDDYFSMSIAASIRKLPLKVKANLKVTILKMVCDAEVANIEQHNDLKAKQLSQNGKINPPDNQTRHKNISGKKADIVLLKDEIDEEF